MAALHTNSAPLFIQNAQGTPEFAVIPMADYELLKMKAQAYDEQDSGEWLDIPIEQEADDHVTIPNEVVNIMFDEDVSLLAAWRIYRGLSQYEVAEQTGLTQSAISQAERKDNQPQKRTREKLAAVYHCSPSQLTI